MRRSRVPALLVGGTLLLCSTLARAIERPPMPSALARTYQGAFFADPQHGYAFGDAIIASDDGGATWRVVRDHIALVSIFFLNGAAFRALDGSGTLLASDDGGHTVSLSAPRFRASESGDVRPICGTLFFLDTARGWTICGRDVLATVDSGRTWRAHALARALGEPRLVWMFNPTDGIATRPFDSLLRTETGGAQWSAVPNTPRLELLSCLPTGFCAGVAGRHGPVVVSTDYGATWADTQAPLQLPDRDELRAIQAVDPKLVLVAGADRGSSYQRDAKPLLDHGQPVPSLPAPRGLLLKWDGAAWTRTTYEDPHRTVGLSFSDASNGWLVGMEENELYRTSNGGATVEFVPDCFQEIAARAASPVPLPTPPAGFATSPTVEDLRTMRATVEQRGLAAFETATRSNGWQAPVIPSAWYVTNVSPVGQRPPFEAARDLGSALLTAVDAWAPAMQTAGPDEVLRKATVLIDLAYWLGATEGYGNLVLSERARDVAVTGLARRVADLAVPLAATAAQLRRCRVPFDTPAVRARVLNFEAGAPLFPTDAAASAGAVAQVWSRRTAKAYLAELDALPTPGPTADDVSQAIEQARTLAAAMGITPGPQEPTDPFFRDEAVPPPLTTRNTWSRKRHERLLGSLTPDNVYGLEILIQFREVIGAFPLQPAVRQETVASPGEEAFADAWRPHIGNATVNLGRPAWSVYDRIQRGEFLDSDSARTRMVLARTPGALQTAGAGPTRTGAADANPTAVRSHPTGR